MKKKQANNNRFKNNPSKKVTQTPSQASNINNKHLLLFFIAVSLLYIFFIQMVGIHVNGGHDAEVQWGWTRAYLYDPSKYYLLSYNLYPRFGGWLIALIYSPFESFKASLSSVKVILSLVEIAIAIVCLYVVKKNLRLSPWQIISLILCLLWIPAMWYPGSGYGQLENIVKLFLMISLLFLTIYLKALYQTRNPSHIFFYGVFFSLCLILAIHTKQVAIFPTLGLGAVYFFATLAAPITTLNKAKYLLINLSLFVLITKMFDQNIEFPDEFFTLYQFLMTFRASFHFTQISGNGSSIWTLLDRTYAPSRDPIIGNFLGLYEIGLIIFALIALIACYRLYQAMLNYRSMNSHVSQRTQSHIYILLVTLMFCCFIGVSYYVSIPGASVRSNYATFSFLILYLFVCKIYVAEMFKISRQAWLIFILAIFFESLFGVVSTYYQIANVLSPTIQHLIKYMSTLSMLLLWFTCVFHLHKLTKKIT